MSKFYKVYLEYEEICLVCKKVPLTHNIYKEIITDRIIYPKSNKLIKKLTYGYLPNGIPRCYKITNSQAKEWLCGLNIEKYISDLERIEDILAKSHKEEIEEKIIYRREEKEADKTIKRTLSKIRYR